MDKKNIKSHLEKHDICPSYQRILIYKYLYENRTHPTLSEIFENLKDKIPTLSKMTIYNTIKLFVEKKITQYISIDDNEIRCDVYVDFHGHFKCCQCGKIYDFPIKKDCMIFRGLDGFDVKKKNIYLYGICKKCKIEGAKK